MVEKYRSQQAHFNLDFPDDPISVTVYKDGSFGPTPARKNFEANAVDRLLKLTRDISQREERGEPIGDLEQEYQSLCFRLDPEKFLENLHLRNNIKGIDWTGTRQFYFDLDDLSGIESIPVFLNGKPVLDQIPSVKRYIDILYKDHHQLFGQHHQAFLSGDVPPNLENSYRESMQKLLAVAQV